jgi:hypothetical protein
MGCDPHIKNKFSIYPATTSKTTFNIWANRVNSTSVICQPNIWQINRDIKQGILDILLRYVGRNPWVYTNLQGL